MKPSHHKCLWFGTVSISVLIYVWYNCSGTFLKVITEINESEIWTAHSKCCIWSHKLSTQILINLSSSKLIRLFCYNTNDVSHVILLLLTFRQKTRSSSLFAFRSQEVNICRIDSMTWSQNGCNPSDLPYTRQIAYLICWEQFGHIFTMTSRDLDLKGYLSSKMYSYIHVLSWQVIWWFCFTGNCVWQVVLFHGTWSAL